MFLTLMVIGLVGLVLMAIPAFGHHHGALHHGGHSGHAALPAASAHGVALAVAAKTQLPADVSHGSRLRFIPSPRAVFSVLALYGAFGNALVHAAHLHTTIAALVAIVPAFLFERLLITPLWNFAFRFQGQPSSSFEALMLTEARALTPFANGKGLIETVRDGRRIQLSARLRDDQRMLSVRVGARLMIEDVDAAKERVTVAVMDRELPDSPA